MTDTPLSLQAISTYLSRVYPLSDPRWVGLWNSSSDNTLASNFLIQTPEQMWGVSTANFKASVAGTYPDFGLQECSAVTAFADSGNKLCRLVNATVKKPGDKPALLYVAPGYGFYERIYDAMINAEHLIDITTLFRPSGQFKAAIKNAITYIAHKPANARPKIRFLHSTMGFPSTASAGADRHDATVWEIFNGLSPFNQVDNILKELTSEVPADSGLEIYLAVVSTGITGWNHSKIVAVDGRRAIVGGENLWDDHYLGPNPVFDLSMELTGTAALHAQQYANVLWLWTPWADAPPQPRPAGEIPRRLPLRARNVVSFKNGVLKEGDFPPDDFYTTLSAGFPAPATGGTAKVMAIGRQAQMRWPELKIPSATGILHALMYRVAPAPEPADDAIVQMFSLAKSSIYLSLQNIQGGGLYYLSLRRPYVEELAKALLRGVQVKMVVSSKGGAGGYDGDNVVDVNLWMRDMVAYANGATWPLPLTDAQKSDAANYVTRNFQCGNLRFSDDQTYPSGTSPLNHAKSFMVDEQLFYVGSHNLYPSNLNEFGFIVEDASAAATYLSDYWTPLWKYSKVTYSSAFTPAGDDDINKAEAACFLADLPHNKRLSLNYGNLLAFRAKYAPAEGDASLPTYKRKTATFLTNLIRDAGYATTAGWVQAALARPPFANDPTTDADERSAANAAAAQAAAQKCITDLTTQKPLMVSFDAVVYADYTDTAAADAALTAWLHDHGYACSASDLNAAMYNAADQALQLWTGFYDGWGIEIADGGTYFTTCPAFDLDSPSDPDYQPDWLPSYPAPADAPTLTISTDATTPQSPIPYVAYGKIAIQNPTFKNGVLSWSKGSGFLGNQTAAELTFSRIMRPALLDSFSGREVYGWIEKADGTRVSYYNRESRGPDHPNTPPATPPDTKANSNYTGIILGCVAAAAVVGVVVLCVRKFRSAQADREYRRVKDDDDHRPDGPGDDAEPPPSAASTSEQLIEMQARTGTISPGEAQSLRTTSESEVADFQEQRAKEQRKLQDDTDDSIEEDEDF